MVTRLLKLKGKTNYKEEACTRLRITWSRLGVFCHLSAYNSLNIALNKFFFIMLSISMHYPPDNALQARAQHSQ